MKEPKNYAEWCNLFNDIVEDHRDENYITLVRNGSIPWISGVAERFVKSAMEMIKTRINKAHDLYQRKMSNCRGIEYTILNALRDLNREYRYVYSITSAFPIPAEHRDQMLKIIRDQANQTQKNLEESAIRDRTGHLSYLVKNSPVNKIE